MYHVGYHKGHRPSSIREPPVESATSITVQHKDREKTAFVCHEGAYQYKRMPFGLINAPATFQRALDIIFSGVKWQSCLIYLDDVIVYSKTEEKHVCWTISLNS